MPFSIIDQVDVPGVRIQIREYNLRVGEILSWREKEAIVAYRSHPIKVSIDGQSPDGPREFGQIMCLPANLDMVAGPAKASERIRIIWCRFESIWLDRLRQQFPSRADKHLAQCFDIQSARIEQRLQRLASEMANPGPATGLLIQTIATEIAIEVARYFGSTGARFRVRTRNGRLSPADFDRIIEFMQIHRNPSTQEIAEACNVSSAHLRRAFKRTTGETIHNYVESIRQRKAQVLLCDTDLPLKEIAYRVGFGGATTFSTTFKRWVGEPPSEYRSKSRGNSHFSCDNRRI